MSDSKVMFSGCDSTLGEKGMIGGKSGQVLDNNSRRGLGAEWRGLR